MKRILILVLLAACDPPREAPKIDRAAVDAKLLRIGTVAGKVAMNSVNDEVAVGKEELYFNERSGSQWNPLWNAGILHLEECRGIAPALSISGSPEWWNPPAEETAANELLLRVRFLLLIRTREYVAPVVLDNGQGLVHYEPGRFAGDALLVNVETQEFLGGFRFQVENPLTVRIDTSLLHLEADLVAAARRTIREMLSSGLPPERLPFSK